MQTKIIGNKCPRSRGVIAIEKMTKIQNQNPRVIVKNEQQFKGAKTAFEAIAPYESMI